MKYSIFKVYNYKGGELLSTVNLDHDQFISTLSEFFENIVFDEKIIRIKKIKLLTNNDDTEIINYIKSLLKDKMNDDNFYSNYANDNIEFCGEIYKIEDDRMTEISIEYYLDDNKDVIRYIVDFMILTGNSKNRVPKIYLNNPSITNKIII